MSDKIKFPAAIARPVGEEILKSLAPQCAPERCVIAGSLRRQAAEVGDIEILFVPRLELAPSVGEMFEVPTDLAARTIRELADMKWLTPRLNAKGRTTWGELIKLTRHTGSGVPVDFFTATAENWWNYLVCRTGPAESNLAIASAARARGLKWKPYTAGFCAADDPDENIIVHVRSEREVFETVRLKYLPPEER